MGEFVAFFIGWNLILEYLIGTASGASALSSMIDSLSNRSISEWSIKNLGKMRQPWEGAEENGYPDLLAMFICLAMVLIVGAGLKNSMMLNNVLNVANLFVWVSLNLINLYLDRKKSGRYNCWWSVRDRTKQLVVVGSRLESRRSQLDRKRNQNVWRGWLPTVRLGGRHQRGGDGVLRVHWLRHHCHDWRRV